MDTNGKFFLGQVMYILKRIKYYRHMYFLTPCFWQKIYWENLITNELFWLNDVIMQVEKEMKEELQPIEDKVFTLEELGQYNGSGGKPAYVAVNGIVYDVSLEPTWAGGNHFGLVAGRDLTSKFAGCHQAQAILKQLPVVGRLKANGILPDNSFQK